MGTALNEPPRADPKASEDAPRPSGFGFRVAAEDPASRARRGRLETPHGAVETPAFVFCATRGTIKAAGPADLERAGAQIVLANTYHMMLRPGGEVVERLGGLHGFTGWRGPMLTDSGGFQVFSLGHGSVADEIKGRRRTGRAPTLVAIGEDGVTFRSYVDGRRELLTPERSMEVQRRLGADLVLTFDECTPFHVSRDYTRRSLERTHRWADRCLAELRRGGDGRQALYGILQGGIYRDLRAAAAEFVSARPFFGHAVGGSLGAEKEQMYDVVGFALDRLRRDRPVHLLGIGAVRDVWECVERGVDTFDCVAPTRIARHGWALTRREPGWRMNLRNARFKLDPAPIDEDCDCPTCRRFSRAYLHYLFKAGEIQAMHHVTVCNVHFMVRLMKEIRASLSQGRFAEAKKAWLEGDP
ncbi:MAG TPA: tRNA guanosine(34) transglycosylase Tgt [Thermoanaerobaculia bacterium]|jgi:queuine tRNA-ribosyltransferase